MAARRTQTGPAGGRRSGPSILLPRSVDRREGSVDQPLASPLFDVELKSAARHRVEIW